jgi:hypothetical protein
MTQSDHIKQLPLYLQTVFNLMIECLSQWASLNGITLGPRQTDPVNQMTQLTNIRFGSNFK